MNILEYHYPSSLGVATVHNFHNEIYAGEYDKFGVSVEYGDIVVDCGANIGIFTIYAKSLGARAVYSFECDDETYQSLIINLGSSDNTKKTFISDRFNDPKHYNVEKIMSEYGLTHIDFMKIDIEGWEYPLILNMNPDTLKKVKKWAIECHNLTDPHYAGKVFQILEKFSINGYSCYYEQTHKQYPSIGMFYFIKNK